VLTTLFVDISIDELIYWLCNLYLYFSNVEMTFKALFSAVGCL
jgi:hypothetical protein